MAHLARCQSTRARGQPDNEIRNATHTMHNEWVEIKVSVGGTDLLPNGTARASKLQSATQIDVTHLWPSSVKAKSPSRRSRKRYLGGSDILLLSNSSDDAAKTSSTGASQVTEAAMYPSFRRVWREFTIRDNTFTTFDTLVDNLGDQKHCEGQQQASSLFRLFFFRAPSSMI